MGGWHQTKSLPLAQNFQVLALQVQEIHQCTAPDHSRNPIWNNSPDTAYNILRDKVDDQSSMPAWHGRCLKELG